MNPNIRRYLKKKGLSDPFDINSLFVSAYIQEKGWNVPHCSVITGLLGYENETLSEFIDLLKCNGFGFQLEDLINLFEFVISPSDRIVTGAVYTPLDVRRKIVKECLKQCPNLKDARIADISCGCGGFLVDVALYLYHTTGRSFRDIFRENIYGIDIQSYSVERTRIILSLLALTYGEDCDFVFHIMEANTLDFGSDNWNTLYAGFDVIVGNPPYVCSRNVDPETKEKMMLYSSCKSGHPDLYLPFFQIAVEMLNDHGVLGYITMNSFIRSVNGRAIRKYFSENKLNIKIVDFRGYQIFQSKSTYTCLFFLKKGVKRNFVQYTVNETGDLTKKEHYSRVAYDILDNVKGWALNDFDLNLQFENVGIPIGKYCAMRHGIATLCNKAYIFSPQSVHDGRYIIEKNGATYEIETGICRDIVNSNKLNSQVLFEEIKEKVIYPYGQTANGVINVIDETNFREKFPYAYAYLTDCRGRLEQRDKGHTEKYPAWYAFGRTQSLKMPRFKLFFPKFSNKPIRCILVDDENLLLYNGIAFVSDEERKLIVLKRILESRLFWSYIQSNGKPYASEYFSLTGIDIKNFSVPDFNEAEEDDLIAMISKEEIEEFLDRYYR